MGTKQQWHGSWYGGPNYRASAEREVFESVRQAMRALIERHEGVAHLAYADGRTEQVATPGVSRDSDIYLYAAPGDAYDEPGHDYPTYRVYFGPRGGVRVEAVA